MWLSLCCSNQSSVLFLFSVFFRVGFPLFPICWEVVRFATSISLLSDLSLNFIQIVSMEMFSVLMKRYLQSPILLSSFLQFIHLYSIPGLPYTFKHMIANWESPPFELLLVHFLQCILCANLKWFSTHELSIWCLSKTQCIWWRTWARECKLHKFIYWCKVIWWVSSIFQVICPIHILRCLCTEDNSIAIWCSFKCSRVKYDLTHLRWYSVFGPL